MSAEVRGLLVSDHKSWMLCFEAPQPDKDPISKGIIGKAAIVAVCLVAWPLLCLTGSVIFLLFSFQYLESVRNQREIVTVLANENNLREFAAKRAESCEKSIRNLKDSAILVMENDVKNPHELGLGILPKKTCMECLIDSRLYPHWDAFSWDDFLRTDFLEKSNIPGNPDKRYLLKLEEIKKKINSLNCQKDLFLQDNVGLAKIQAVVQMSFVQNAFRKQHLKEGMIRSVCWLFPLGVMADGYFSRLRSDRLTYENNKSFLPSEVGLDSYKDLIEAHNQLLDKNPFLVPYIVSDV